MEQTIASLENLEQRTKEHEIYIRNSKQAIGWFIMKSDYKSAISVLLGLHYQINDDERQEIINIFHKIMVNKNKKTQ